MKRSRPGAPSGSRHTMPDRCGATQFFAMTEHYRDMRGEVVGSWELVRVLGVGGFGAVYEGRHLVSGARSAVKILRASLRQETLQRFERGCRCAAALKHPGIVRVIDGGAHEGHPFIVMAFVEGETLRHDLASTGRFEIDAAREVILTLAGTLGYLHENNVIHRDIKPSNVIRDRHGELLLADFDLARPIVDDVASLTQEGTGIGTVSYMAPEQIRGRECDARTDIYSLGALWYELLEGSTPFGSDTPITLASRILREAPRPFTRPGIPARDAALILEMLSREPADRPASCAEVVARIEQPSGEDVPAARRRRRRAPIARDRARSARMSRSLVQGAPLSLIALALVPVAFLVLSRMGARETQEPSIELSEGIALEGALLERGGDPTVTPLGEEAEEAGRRLARIDPDIEWIDAGTPFEPEEPAAPEPAAPAPAAPAPAEPAPAAEPPAPAPVGDAAIAGALTTRVKAELRRGRLREAHAFLNAQARKASSKRKTVARELLRLRLVLGDLLALTVRASQNLERSVSLGLVSIENGSGRSALVGMEGDRGTFSDGERRFTLSRAEIIEQLDPDTLQRLYDLAPDDDAGMAARRRASLWLFLGADPGRAGDFVRAARAAGQHVRHLEVELGQ